MARTTARNKLTAKAAIAKVLGDHGKPMKVPEIIAAAVPLTNLGGATPGQTIYSVLYSENKKVGNARQFVSVGRGEFKLNGSFKPVERKAKTSGSKTKTAAPKKAAARKTASRKASVKSIARKSTPATRRTRSGGKTKTAAAA